MVVVSFGSSVVVGVASVLVVVACSGTATVGLSVATDPAHSVVHFAFISSTVSWGFDINDVFLQLFIQSSVAVCPNEKFPQRKERRRRMESIFFITHF